MLLEVAMNMFEEAKSILGMLSLKNMTQAELAKFLGVSQSYVANKLRLLRFSRDVQSKILKSGITERHARALLRLPEGLITDAIDRIRNGKMTAMESEIMIDCMLEQASHEEICKAVNYSERVGRFEQGVEMGIDNLRRLGISAKAIYERREDKLLISISVG